MGKKNTYKVLVRKCEEMRSLSKRERTEEDNLTMDLEEVWWEGVNGVHWAQNADWWPALVNTLIRFQVQ
jgi:hypothetical protein